MIVLCTLVFWHNSEAQDAVNVMEKEKMQKYKKYNVDQSDQVYQISDIRNLKKDLNWTLKLRKVQY